MSLSPRTWTAIAVTLFNILVSYGLVLLIAPGRTPEAPLAIVAIALGVLILALVMAIRGWRRAMTR